ncbi:hypothetical protein B484DRAFT_392049, partial [Ochromonadaceae sp. CCMP2298]
MPLWRSVWESTSTALEQLQCNLDCVSQESASLAVRRTPPCAYTFTGDSEDALLVG